MGNFLLFLVEYSVTILQRNLNLKSYQSTMSNSSNSKQIENLISIMEKNKDIANGFVTNKSKDDVQKFWKQLEQKLNSIGPPMKSIVEWKKVWQDKKKYVRKKLSENLKNKKATGGGPYKEYKFSSLEETIIKICDMGESVEGIPNSSTFGLPSSSRKRNFEEENKLPSSICNRPVEGEGNNILDEDTLLEMLNNSPDLELQQKTIVEQEADESVNMPYKKSRISRPTKERQSVIPTGTILEKELEIQRELCNKIDDAVLSMKHHHEEMQSSFKKIYRSIDRLFDQRKKTLEETKRHNLEMEKIRMQEIQAKHDFKKRLLEIEEAKLQKMQ